MKEMSKAKIIDKKSISSIKNERNFLSYLNHPFIVNMHYAFQDNLNLYLIIDLFTGGDLRYQLCQNYFNEKETKFFIACIILSLEYIHKNNIMHRDLKPENLILDSNGKVHLTDFGIAKKISANSTSKDTSGTPGYMAPEVMCGLDHNFAVDFFALGIIAFELMHHYRPYKGNSRKEIKENIMAKQVRINLSKIPNNWSKYSADFINKLIMRKPIKRLGFNGIKELKEHLWFKDFNWGELYLGKMKAPFLPFNKDNYDYKYCNAIEKIGINTLERYNKILKCEEFTNCFMDYEYFDRKLQNKNNKVTKKNYVDNPHIAYEIEYDLEMEVKNKKKIKNKLLNDKLINTKTINFFPLINEHKSKSHSKSNSKSKNKEKSFMKLNEEKLKLLKKERSFNKNYHYKKKSKPKINFDEENKDKMLEKNEQKKFVNNINVLIFNYQQNNSSIGKNFHRRNFSYGSTNINSNSKI